MLILCTFFIVGLTVCECDDEEPEQQKLDPPSVTSSCKSNSSVSDTPDPTNVRDHARALLARGNDALDPLLGQVVVAPVIAPYAAYPPIPDRKQSMVVDPKKSHNSLLETAKVIRDSKKEAKLKERRGIAVGDESAIVPPVSDSSAKLKPSQSSFKKSTDAKASHKSLLETAELLRNNKRQAELKVHQGMVKTLEPSDEEGSERVQN